MWKLTLWKDDLEMEFSFEIEKKHDGEVFILSNIGAGNTPVECMGRWGMKDYRTYKDALADLQGSFLAASEDGKFPDEGTRLYAAAQAIKERDIDYLVRLFEEDGTILEGRSEREFDLVVGEAEKTIRLTESPTAMDYYKRK